MDDNTVVNMEKQVESTTASYGVSSIPFSCSSSNSNTMEQERNVENDPIAISHSFVNNTNYIHNGPLDPVTVIFSSVEQATLNKSIDMNDNINNTEQNVNDDVNIANNEQIDDAIAVHSIEENENESSEQGIFIRRNDAPINEFTDNNLLILQGFPNEFATGKGIDSKGTQTPQAIQHMMFQFHKRMANNHRLIFLLFNQFQRHAVAKIICSKFKTDRKSLKRLGNMVSSPDFREKLREAGKNPKSKLARDLLEKIMPFVELSNSKVPFTKAARKASMSKLIAMKENHEIPSAFITITPDDGHDPNRIRLALPQNNNFEFPADPENFLEALQKCDPVYKDIPISDTALLELLAKGPIASAEMFSKTISNFFTAICTQPDHKIRKKNNVG